ncbi:hypothetical protein FAI40_06415 [Acetobacteraceae bacterium]|nr:hypothetical protein FAI40_06415 [Acetobacteraceae bacterium]
MRILLIMRGPPSCGKSSWIAQRGLQPYTLSAEQINLQFSNPTFQEDGTLAIDHSISSHLSSFLEKQLLERLKKGETTVIDSTASNREILTWANLARLYHYKILVLDFTTALQTCLERNENRRGTLSYLPAEKVTHLWNVAQTSRENLKKYLRFEAPDTFSLEKDFSLKVTDLNAYQEIISIGDIHGCRQHLEKLLPNGIEENKFYIFVGDYLDRGYDNAGVMNWLWQNCFQQNVRKSNVILLAGNHERYLQAWLNNEKLDSDEFTGRTRPELLKSNWHPSTDKFKIFLKSLSSCFCYKFHEKKVFLSHAGVPALIESLWKISAKDFEKGWGNHDTDIDRIFSKNMTGREIYQIHGHRNALNYPTLATNISFNLVGKVEFGGELRAIRHTENDFMPFSASVLIESTQQKYDIVPVPENIKALFTEQSCPHCDAAFFEELKAEKNVQVTPQKGWQDIISLRLKKNNEKEKVTPLKPQGLFLNQKTNIILARSYNKFTHIGGKQSLEKMTQRFAYPVSVRRKENGFIGLTGCDGDNHLLLASRNYLTGPFAENFAEKVTEDLGNKILTLNETFGVSCLFEVIDPDQFPNIIKYDHPQLLLLDIIYREEAFKKLPYEALPEIAEFLGLPYSKRIATLKTKEEFLHFLKKAESSEDAGYIFEDQNNFIVKYRTPYYQAWSLMNGVLHTILEGKKKRFPSELLRLYRKYPNYFTEEKQVLLRVFYDYLETSAKSLLSEGLIAVRDCFFNLE